MAHKPDIRLQHLVTEIEERLAMLERARPTRREAMKVSKISKLPFKVVMYRESLIWRMTELSRSALTSLQQQNLASGVLLVRAVVETTAALWYLQKEIQAVVDRGTVGNVDESLMRLLMGSRTNPDLPKPFRVMKFVETVDSDVPGFKEQYEAMCEYAHPNWAGTSLLYSRSDLTTRTTEFGANIRGKSSSSTSGVVNLSVALRMFQLSYERVGKLVDSFVPICEKHLLQHRVNPES